MSSGGPLRDERIVHMLMECTSDFYESCYWGIIRHGEIIWQGASAIFIFHLLKMIARFHLGVTDQES